MKQRVILYILLFISLFLQVSFMGRVNWFPDLVLLVVIFTGMFRGSAEGGLMGLAAGFLRGCFSINTFVLDLFLFPVVGLVSSIMPRLFYRQNAAAQVFVVLLALLAVVNVHTFYMNSIWGNDIGLSTAIFNSRGVFAGTLIAAPLLFAFLQRVLQVEDEI
jgi:rod shape-determining protein MreD